MNRTSICNFCGEYEHDCKCAAAKAIARLTKKIQQLETERVEWQRNPAMPGAFKCDKCGFILQKNTLHASDGSISADTSLVPNEVCPNDGQIMRGFTWREANDGFSEAHIKGIQERDQLKAALEKYAAILETNLDNLRQLLNFAHSHGFISVDARHCINITNEALATAKSTLNQPPK
jgi:hypothetical protein